MPRYIRKAIFPVAGMGTRFLPATKAVPKEMFPVVDKPLIQYAVEEALAAGIEHFIFVTGKGKNAIENHFDSMPELECFLSKRCRSDLVTLVTDFIPKFGEVSYTRQHAPIGLGHAVWCARNLVEQEPFAIILPDDLILARIPCLEQLINAHAETGGNIVAVVNVPLGYTERYGILEIECDYGRLVKARKLVEKPDLKIVPSCVSITGRYIVHPEIFEYLSYKTSGSGNEIQLTDALNAIMNRVPFYGLRFKGQRFDCGDKIGLLYANIFYALQCPETREGAMTVLRNFSPQA